MPGVLGQGGEIMTFREKLQQEHPESISASRWGGCCGCPASFYAPPGDGLCGLDQNGITDKTCRKCWDREMQEGTDDGESSYHNEE